MRHLLRHAPALALAMSAWSSCAHAQMLGDPRAAAAYGSQAGITDTQREQLLQAQREAERLRDEAMQRFNRRREQQTQAERERDDATLNQPRQWLERFLQVPAAATLSAENRVQAEATLQPARERALSAWPAWREQALALAIAAEAAGKASLKASGTQVEQAALVLSARVLNEAASWIADAEPHPSDAAWIEALRSDSLCRHVRSTEPGALVASLIEALPAERRATAWAGEAARLARWGQAARTLPAPADRALEDHLQAALPATAASWPAAVRDVVTSAAWRDGSAAPAARCEVLRWWSQEQVRRKEMGPRQALFAWRSALAVRSGDFVLAAVPRGGALDEGGYPPVARRLALSGKVVVEQDVDAAGKVVHSFVQRRELRTAWLGEPVPLALERELDRATLERVAATPAAAPDPASLRDGVATRRVAMEWVLK